MGEEQRPAKQVRRRGAALEGPIFLAAWDELAEAGFADFQMSRVAKRAKASKATLYRRWPDRYALIVGMLRYLQGRGTWTTPVTGDLREDLLQLLREHVAALAHSPLGPALRGIVTEMRPEAADLRTPRRAGPVLDILAASGVVTPEEMPRVVVNLGMELVSNHYFSTGEGLSEDELAEIVDMLWIPALTHATSSQP